MTNYPATPRVAAGIAYFALIVPAATKHGWWLVAWAITAITYAVIALRTRPSSRPLVELMHDPAVGKKATGYGLWITVLALGNAVMLLATTALVALIKWVLS